jgi:hypothetical protein
MYKIILKDNGNILSLCDEIRYIKVNPNSGCYIQATAKEAEGIAVAGAPYSLNGKLDGLQEVVAVEIDSGEVIFDNTSTLNDISASIDDIIVSILE